MWKFLLFLGMGISPAPPSPNPADLLATAVAQARSCGYQKKLEILNEEHQRIGFGAIEKAEESIATKLSLPILFKQGRFDLGQEVVVREIDGQKLFIVNFAPWPEDQQLKSGPGEDYRYVWAMNKLSGEVYIDEAGGIVRIEAKVEQQHTYTIARIDVFHLHELTFLMAQDRSGLDTLPNMLQMEIRYTNRRKFFPLLWNKVHEKYTLTFQCPTN